MKNVGSEGKPCDLPLAAHQMSRKRFLAYSAVLGVSLALSPLVGCSSGTTSSASNASNANAVSEPITTGPVGVIEEAQFNAILIDLSQQAFLDLGFQLGDSVDIELSNGMTFEDVPFYNGYYALTGAPIVVSYPGVEHPKFTRAQKGIWDECDLPEDATITVTLREAGKYLDVQHALNLVYSNDRADFSSDAAFANFRACTGGKLRSNLVYRSASPIDNTYNRAPYANALAAAAGIQYGLDLSDDEESFAKYASLNGDICAYYVDLHDAGKVETIKLSAAFAGDVFKTSIAAAFARMCEQPGPYLVHCVEGKDRTGFACMILEALAGATVDELIDDYMITYDNYYHVNKVSDPECYEAIKAVSCYDSLMTVAGVTEVGQVTNDAIRAGAERYLREGGLTDDQIARIKAVLTQ